MWVMPPVSNRAGLLDTQSSGHVTISHDPVNSQDAEEGETGISQQWQRL